MPHAIWFLAVLGAYSLERSMVLGGFFEDNFPASVIEDAHLNTIQLLEKYKHPAETHQVTTEDKYILTLHRIPRPGAKPVLLVHGLEDTSSTWIVMGPHSGLGYFLYANGYDVWMGNVRGNRYSRGHMKLNPNSDKAYWSFTWHEIGMYDLPAMIDYVLKKTGSQKLSYFGHSQGTTSFFVMASSRPEYNSKIHLMSALAPVAFMKHMKAPLMGMARMGFNMFGTNFELFPHSFLYLNQCVSSASMLKTCLRFYWQIVGKNREEFNMTMFPVVLGHIPGGCNVNQPLHYIQLQNSDRFCQYDYELKENQKLYGRPTPPEYRLEKISAPVALYYGSNDFLSAAEDVQRLAKMLPNVVENHLNRKWNHMDMIWGISARSSIQPRMLQVMQYWEDGGGTKGVTTGPPVEEEVPQATTEYQVEGNTEESEEVGSIAGNEEQREKDQEDSDLGKAVTNPTSEL
ncbi:LOW QUALITY PROTEIN: lipase 1 [Drosophila eugracilis]|uniref:LOW QUALITY PROTEIN: lipase 1 n=1 Tax=Drosophila eugracilis TaxID=29029 RepID=UPI001BDA978E|nr:LOW QUALITY PROTEIN: lipase 1 [Drosophila eugracilis]